MRILALDLGDQWTGTAISDPLSILASPYKTIPTEELIGFLEKIIKKKDINTIIIGYPKTMKGKISQQTEKILNQKKILDEKFQKINILLWDERLTSKIASSMKKKEKKIKLHSIAAALILESYLIYLKNKKSY